MMYGGEGAAFMDSRGIHGHKGGRLRSQGMVTTFVMYIPQPSVFMLSGQEKHACFDPTGQTL